MDLNNIIIKTKDGGEALQQATNAPSAGDVARQLSEESVKKKRRRGKTKRKILFTKVPWQNRRKIEISKRNSGIRKIALRNTHAPYNNNQFLMEIHKPEPENNFQILQTPTARTRDSSFSVDSEENNYFYSLPADEEEFLTKEFSSVYEDAQCERLAAMTKNELIQEYLVLEAKYDKLLCKLNEDKNTTDTTATDGESMSTDRETTATSIELSITEESKDTKMQEIVQHMKDLEEQVRQMKSENEKLRVESIHLRKQVYHSSSADSESDSSSTSASCSSSSSTTSSRNSSPEPTQVEAFTGVAQQQLCENNMAEVNENDIDPPPLVNGYHNGSNTPKADDGQME